MRTANGLLRPITAWLVVASLLPGSAAGCTAVDLQAADGSVVAGRTMEWSADLRWELVAVPRGSAVTLSAPPALQRAPTRIETRYGFVGIAPGGDDPLAVLEGQNSAGLGFSANFLPGFTRYQEVGADDPSALPIQRFGAWALGSFASVDALRSALASVKVWSEPSQLGGSRPATLHFIFVDRSGRGLVVEYIDGRLELHDNLVHVLTNAPPYDWQMQHLRLFLDVDPVGRSSASFGDLSLRALGAGSNLRGLPGDGSPPSRFVRMAFMRARIAQPGDGAQALQAVGHLLNTVDIPAGIVGERVGSQVVWDTTQWLTLKDLTHDRFYLADAGHRTQYLRVDLKPLEQAGRIKRRPLAELPYPEPAEVSAALR